uniref:Epsilon-sarcoglycan n=1 Tax=Dicentrarchus labrax TaxID=13489 RepID=E6ZHW2_DICLA|nr:Epsilon-sarcoglycan [Dicentrarchus labrax]
MVDMSLLSLTEKMLPYQAEFFIKLREIEKVLPSPVQDEIQQDLQKLWNTEALEIVNISNAKFGTASRMFLVCAVSLLGANAEIKFTIPVGKLFTYELLRETFQNDFEPLSKLYAERWYDDPMIFKCNLQNFPDLPEWLRFTQRHPLDNGFLYGTPTSPGKSVIEIYAFNNRSYDTTRQILVIKVIAEKMLPYQAEFFIKLREIEKVLPSPVQDEIQQDLQKLWNTEALEIVNISNALDRGGRVPLPLAGHFEGVYVKVGSEKYFSNCLLKVLTSEHQKQCSSGARVKVPGGCNFCSIPSNCITWCKTELFDLTKQEPAPPAPTMGSGIVEAGGDFDPPESPPSRDFFPDYIVTVIVPLILAIILCILLAYIMFGRREGVYASVLNLANKEMIYKVIVMKGQFTTLQKIFPHLHLWDFMQPMQWIPLWREEECKNKPNSAVPPPHHPRERRRAEEHGWNPWRPSASVHTAHVQQPNRGGGSTAAV